jgi:hypothetical protein
MAHKKRSSLALMGEALIQQLQSEGRYERSLSRFEPDDDAPSVPDGGPLASAQSRRALPVEVH